MRRIAVRSRSALIAFACLGLTCLGLTCLGSPGPLLTSQAWADVVEGESAISAVTLYRDRAAIMRTGSAELEQGQHEIVVSGLPAQIIEGTIRALTDGATLQSVDIKRLFSDQLVNPKEKDIRQQIAQLDGERVELLERQQAFESQLGFIDGLATAITERLATMDFENALDPDLWQQSWTGLREGETETRLEINRLKKQQHDIENRIETLKRELEQITTNAREEIEVRLAVSTDAAQMVDFAIEYQLSGSSWQVAYEARLATEDGTVVFNRYANIRQTTGEDWQDVDLTLSGSMPGRRTDPPRPATWNVDIIEPLAYQTRSANDASYERSLLPTAQAADVAAVVEASEFQSRFKLSGSVDLPADGRNRRVLVESTLNGSEMTVRAVPSQDLQAFLMAAFKLDSEAPIAPGPLDLYVDGNFVGKSRMASTASGEMIDMSFGVDDGLTIDRRLETGGRSSSGIINKSRVIERSYLIEITNLHKRTIKTRVLEPFPVARDERIEITMSDNTTEPDERDAEGTEGLLAWDMSLQPAETRLIRVGYRISYPTDLNITGLGPLINEPINGVDPRR